MTDDATMTCTAIHVDPDARGPRTVILRRTDGRSGWISITGDGWQVERFEVGRAYRLTVEEVPDAM